MLYLMNISHLEIVCDGGCRRAVGDALLAGADEEASDLVDELDRFTLGRSADDVLASGSVPSSVNSRLNVP